MPENKTLILNNQQIHQKINRIAYQIYEDNYTEDEIIVVGIANKGFLLATKLVEKLKNKIRNNSKIKFINAGV